MRYPAQLLDLSRWRLELPGEGHSIYRRALSVFTDDHFHFNAAKNGVVMRVGCGEPPRQPVPGNRGSAYPRVELHEREAWSTVEGAHAMEATLAITRAPAAKPHLVAGQIHNATDDVVMVRLEGEQLYAAADGRKILLDGAYKLGAVFDVKLSAVAGLIEVFYNGVRATFPACESACYFKIGVYVQSNPATGDGPGAFGEVVIHKLQVSHKKI